MAPIENSPPGIHAIPRGAGAGAEWALRIVGAKPPAAFPAEAPKDASTPAVERCTHPIGASNETPAIAPTTTTRHRRQLDPDSLICDPVLDCRFGFMRPLSRAQVPLGMSFSRMLKSSARSHDCQC
jgi:hypothetical protein